MTLRDPRKQIRAWWTPALYLAVIALVVAVAVIATARLTRERAARNESAQVMKVLRTVLPESGYDNAPDQDRILVTDATLLGSDQPLPVYRARRAGEPAAIVITAMASEGYVGPIRLLVGITADGRVSAVRAVAHKETPGIGDRIDAAKSGWIGIFTGRSLHDPEPPGWTVRLDGGEFDQLTGATITSRAVVKAVRDAETYFQINRERLFQQPAAL